MKSFLLAFAVAVVLAVIGGVLMSNFNTPADRAFSDSASVRLGA
jgi:preprotein translocase subunit SecG